MCNPLFVIKKNHIWRIYVIFWFESQAACPWNGESGQAVPQHLRKTEAKTLPSKFQHFACIQCNVLCTKSYLSCPFIRCHERDQHATQPDRKHQSNRCRGHFMRSMDFGDPGQQRRRSGRAGGQTADVSRHEPVKGPRSAQTGCYWSSPNMRRKGEKSAVPLSAGASTSAQRARRLAHTRRQLRGRG